MSQALVPFSFRSPELPQMEPIEVESDELSGMGVLFTFPGKELDARLETVQTWYEDRDEVILIDYGITDKQGNGFICMEWDGWACDQLFLDILRTDETIIDYAVYEVQA